MDRHRLRTTFEEVPALYDRVRPAYPAGVLDNLVALAKLPDDGRIVEIGCGTGQATLPLGERGFEMICVELGAGLAAVARRKLAPFPKVQIVNALFETWEPNAGAFDAVVAFTAFHWIDPEVRYSKAARLLREGGALAVVATQHVLTEDGDRFFADVQEDYEAVEPSADNRPPPHPDEVRDLSDEIDASGRFRNVAVRRHLWDVTYTTNEYIDLLDTYSGHRAMDDGARALLYDRIRRRIETRPEQQVRKTYVAILNVARRS